MFKKCKSILFYFDLIGISPQLLTFRNKRYKSIFSAFTSVIIIIFSIIFIILSLVQYLKYESPIITYSKGNDENTRREVFIKDIILMFQLIDSTSGNFINNSTAYYDAEYRIFYYNGSYLIKKINIEKCEIGKNIDYKYKDFIKDKSNFGKEYKDFYCIDSKNMPLFYYPNDGFSSINLLIKLKNNNNCIPEKIQSLIVSENNLINHYDKNNPITTNYDFHITSGFSSLEFTEINYNIQYIKYESDDGFFFKNNKNYSGISFSDISSRRYINNEYELKNSIKKLNYSIIGSLEISINKPNFDYYKRTYKKIQSFLAEIMSVINLVIEIGRQISIIICEKSMSKDIIKSLLNKDKVHNIKNNRKNNNIFSKLKKENYESIDKLNNTDYFEKKDKSKLDISKKINFSESDKIFKINTNNEIIKKMNYYHILRSYFCLKDKKSILINICHNIINEDLCIERILARFYNLENKINLILDSKKKTIKFIEDKKSKKINNYCNIIDNKIKKEFISKNIKKK